MSVRRQTNSIKQPDQVLSPPPPTIAPKIQGNFISELDFRVRSGGWLEGDKGGSLERTYEALVETQSRAGKAYRVHMENPAASEIERERAAADTIGKLLTVATRKADTALQNAEAEADELRTKLQRDHLRPSRDAREELRFQNILQRLEGRSDRFIVAFTAAREGDAETVRALLTAPRWYWSGDGLQPLSTTAEDAIRRAYLLRVAPSELQRVELLEAGIERVRSTAQLLISQIGDAVDFAGITEGRVAEAQARQLAKVASEAAAASNREAAN